MQPHAASLAEQTEKRRWFCRPPLREPLVFFAFLVLTILMTWPWAIHLRDAAADNADTYAHTYFLWWDYHQTLRDPVNLFQATIFFPYHDTLAFGESDFGISLVFIPLFILGFRPLTVYNVAALLSFPFAGYGAFRLGRTLSGSYIVAAAAGIVFAFIPYRFQHLGHLPTLYAAWIPLLLEALVLFSRKPTFGRTVWLIVAFVMNALTCLTWLMLSLIPLALSGLILAHLYRRWREGAFWARLASAGAAAGLLLLPFLIPYFRVARRFELLRGTEEIRSYSALPINWLASVGSNRIWSGFGAAGASSEMFLFPGLLPPLLALAALLLVAPKLGAESGRLRRLFLLTLDFTAVVCGIVALLAAGYEHFKIQVFGRTLLTANDPKRALIILLLIVLVRCVISVPHALRNLATRLKELFGDKRAIDTSGAGFSETLVHGILWATIGFMGSFGLNFYFHRILYEVLPFFHGLRPVVRWAMIAYLGLALLAGIGVKRFAQLINRNWPALKTPIVSGVVIAAILFEQQVSDVPLVKGEPDPDQLALYLKTKKMAGGIVEMPVGEAKNRYMLRAADHGQPIVTARSSFNPPIDAEIEALVNTRPIPDRMLDLLEEIPASYVAFHPALASPEKRYAIQKFLDRAVALGRLTYIRSFEGVVRDGAREQNDLYAVSRIEPDALPEAPRPSTAQRDDLEPMFEALTGDLRHSIYYSLYCLYRVSYGRAPLFAEFMTDVQEFKLGTDEAGELEEQGLVKAWTGRAEFTPVFDRMDDKQFVDVLIDRSAPGDAVRRALFVDQLKRRETSRSAVLQALIDDNDFRAREFNGGFVRLCYFGYLRRDPDEGGFHYWLRFLDRSSDYHVVTESFSTSVERLDQRLE
jgi:hypothetical protein